MYYNIYNIYMSIFNVYANNSRLNQINNINYILGKSLSIILYPWIFIKVISF